MQLKAVCVCVYERERMYALVICMLCCFQGLSLNLQRYKYFPMRRNSICCWYSTNKDSSEKNNR